MQITSAQLKLIEDLLPVQRSNVTLSNLQAFNAILYVAEHGCKWSGLAKKLGNWHSIYTRANRWAKNVVFDKYSLHCKRVTPSRFKWITFRLIAQQ